MISVFILGFPRTATTYLYRKLLERLKIPSIYEPFNADAVYQAVWTDCVLHDQEGYVPSNLRQFLPSDVVNLMIENSLWFYEWSLVDKPLSPICGFHMWELLERIDALETPFLIKDVIAWVYADKIVDRFPRTKFIFTVKDLDSVKNAFLEWYRYWSFTSRFRRWLKTLTLRKVVTKAHRVGQAITRLITPLPQTHPRRFFLVGFFYRHFNNFNYPRERSKKTLLLMLETVYRKYCEIVSSVESRSNVYVLHFEKRLSDELIEKVIKWIEES